MTDPIYLQNIKLVSGILPRYFLRLLNFAQSWWKGLKLKQIRLLIVTSTSYIDYLLI